MLKGALVAVALSLSFTSFAHAASVEVHGSTTVANNILLPHQSKIEADSGVSLSIVANGSSRGINDLVSGKADMAMISATLETTVSKINKKSPGAVDPAELQAHQVGETTVAFITHPSNPVKELTLDQVKKILLGEITNWSDVGGEDKPIAIIAEDSSGGLRALVEKKLLSKASIAGKLKEVPNGPQVFKIVKQLPTAFGVAMSALVDESVSRVTTDQQISQPLILVTKGVPDTNAEKVIAAAKAAGQ